MRPGMMFGVAMILALPVSAGASPGLEEVIEKHIAARGGKERWEAIETMRLTGSYTAFSKTAPFTLLRKRDTSYFLDHELNEHKAVVGFDGGTAWQYNEMFDKKAQKLDGADLAALRCDLDIPTPLFVHEERGYQVKLLGETEIEGLPAIGLELTRGEGAVETWYLDPETYLEIAREAPGSDFGSAVRQLTFFDDFREVEGVMIPHVTESQWYTRHRVMEVDRVELNVALNDALFHMPLPPGMGPIQPLAGEWKVAVARRQQPGAPWQESERTGTIEILMAGALLQERYTTAEGNEGLWTLSYDPFGERYRYTEINDVLSYLDVEEGNMDDQGRLVLSNVETGTTFQTFGFTVHGRVTFLDITDGGFRVEKEASIDGGQNWFVAVKETYTRPGAGEQ